jgi:nucleotide-binding universal stress UspA family protein
MTCLTTVVAARWRAMFSIIVVGTDGSVTAHRAVRQAAELARLGSARVHIVCGYRLPADMAVIGPMGMALGVGSEEEVRSEVELMLGTLGAEIAATGVAVALHAIPGRGADAILDVAERQHADLIVLGNRGVQGARPFLGSVPFNVLQHARCAVIVFDTSGEPNPASP